MYNSVKELHIALDVATQNLQSQYYRNIESEERDMLLNSAVEEYIITRTGNQRDTHQIGFVNTFARLTELSDLIVTKTMPLTNFNGILDRYDFKQLHPNIKYIVDGEVLIALNACIDDIVLTTSARKQFIVDINISDLLSEDYENKIYLEHITRSNTTGSNFAETTSTNVLLDITQYTNKYITAGEGNFNFINYILEQLNHYVINSSVLKPHDELLDIYCYQDNNSLIFVVDYITPIVYDNSGVAHDETSFIKAYQFELDAQGDPTVVKHEHIISNYEYNVNSNAGAHAISPLEFTTVDKISDITHNTISSKNRHKKPITRIEENVLKINNSNYFYSINVMLRYIKQPRRFDYITGQMCEIKDTEGILRIAVKLMESYLLNKDTNSYQIKEKNSIIIN